LTGASKAISQRNVEEKSTICESAFYGILRAVEHGHVEWHHTGAWRARRRSTDGRRYDLALVPNAAADGAALCRRGRAPDRLRDLVAIVLRRVPDGQIIHTLVGQQTTVFSVAFSPDGTLLAASGSDSSIWLWQVTDGKLFRVITIAEMPLQEVYRVVFSLDGQTLISFSRQGTARIWRVHDGQLLDTSSLERDGKHKAMAFNAPRQLLAARVSPTTIKIWRMQDRQVLTTINGFPLTYLDSEGGRDLFFSPDGVLLASLDDHWIIRLWQVDDGRLLATLSGHTDEIRSVTFSPDGRILASASGNPYLFLSGHEGSGDRTIRLWSVPEGRSLATYSAHSDAISGLAFSPDGRWLASGSADTIIRLWKMQ
jgi:WD40 repeat protein